MVVVLPQAESGECPLLHRDEAEREGNIEGCSRQCGGGQGGEVAPGIARPDREARDERQRDAGGDDREPPEAPRHVRRRGVGSYREDGCGEQQIDPEKQCERNPRGSSDPWTLRAYDLAEDRGRKAADDPEPDEDRRHLPTILAASQDNCHKISWPSGSRKGGGRDSTTTLPGSC